MKFFHRDRNKGSIVDDPLLVKAEKLLQHGNYTRIEHIVNRYKKGIVPDEYEQRHIDELTMRAIQCRKIK
jgi:hypothetical protein